LNESDEILIVRESESGETCNSERGGHRWEFELGAGE
jgi:hypothetical protein